MPKVKISEYSATANSNTDVASINIDEGCAPSGINNAIRAIMGHLKDFQSGTSNDPFTVGSSGSLTLSYGTINGVAYLNGAKVLTTGSALVFDGTNLTASAGGSSLRFTGTAGNKFIGQADALITGASSTDFGLQATNNIVFAAGGTTEGLRLTSTSLYTASTINVGIGTSSPSNRLTVKPSATSNGTLDVLTGSTNTDSIRISGGGTVNTWLEMRGYLGVKLYSDATNTVTVDTSGNLGLGVTPSLSTSNYRTLQIGGTAKFSIFGQRDAGACETFVGWNAYGGSNTTTAGSGFYYTNTGDSATMYSQNAQHAWFIAPSGTANNLITFTQAMTLDASGNLLVGGTGLEAAERLNVRRASITTSALTVNVVNTAAISTSKNASSLLRIASNANGADSSIQLTDSVANNYYFGGNNGGAYVMANTNGVRLSNGGTSWASDSDERVKDIIEPILDAANKVLTLRAVIGKYKTDKDGTRRSFLIAQDVQAVLPEAVFDEQGTLMLAYTDTIPLLVAAIKEQQAIIESLKARLDAANL